MTRPNNTQYARATKLTAKDRILLALSEGPADSAKIAAHTKTDRSTVLWHLKGLLTAGKVKMIRASTNQIPGLYELAPGCVVRKPEPPIKFLRPIYIDGYRVRNAFEYSLFGAA